MAAATAAQTTNVGGTSTDAVGAALQNVFSDPKVIGAIGGTAGAIVNALLPGGGQDQAAQQAAAAKAAAEAKQTQMLIIGGAVVVVLIIGGVILWRRGKG